MNKILLFLMFSISQLFAGLIHPPDGSELSYIHIMFQWEAESNTTEYKFELSRDNFSTILISTTVTDLQYLVTDYINWQTAYSWRVSGDGGQSWINTFNFSTSESSATFQNDDNPIEILEYNPDLTSDGITIFGSYYNNYSAAIDMNGNEVWNSGGVNTHVFFSVDEHNNYLGGKFLPQFNNSLIGCEFSLNNSIFWSEPLNEDILANESFTQHEFIKLPNGNYMGFVPVIEKHPIPTYTNYPEQVTPFSWENDCGLYIEFNSNFDWKGEKIVEWNSAGEIVWEWNVFDYFNINDFDYLAGHWETACNSSVSYDWIHFNALAFNQAENALYVSSRHLDRITKIDYNSKNIIWNMGIPWYGDEVIVPDTLFSGQHGLQLLPNGNIVTLDNGILSQFMNSSIESPVSRAIEIEISENNCQLSARTVWSHTLPYNLYGALSGNVQKLENGNYLINTIGNIDGAYSIEVTQNHETAWMCKYNLGNYNTGPLYRAMKIPGLYDNADNNLEIEGCIDESACNYNSAATMDDESCKYIVDCASECGGSAIVDVCGICRGCETDENNCLGIHNDIAVAKQFHIERLYPNPFNPTVTIEYEISQLTYISGKIFNLKGQLIETLFSEYKSIGSYNLIWNASLYPSGIYLFILENNSELLIKKIILLK